MNNINEEYRTTKEGEKIAVGDMTESHLRNVLRMLLREYIDFDDTNEPIAYDPEFYKD